VNQEADHFGSLDAQSQSGDYDSCRAAGSLVLNYSQPLSYTLYGME
jgi:hypothetical protein